MTDEPVPEAYVVGHVQDALGSDPRVGEWGLSVEVVGRRLVVAGTVATPARKAAVGDVAAAALAALGCDHEVQDRTEVAAGEAPVGEEAL